MERIEIIKTDSTEKDEITKSLIGTMWHSYEQRKDCIVIVCCGGVILYEGEYKFV